MYETDRGYATTLGMSNIASNTLTTSLSPVEIIRQGEQSMLNRCIAELYEEANAATWSEDERIAIITAISRLKEMRTEAIQERRMRMEMEEKRAYMEMEQARMRAQQNAPKISVKDQYVLKTGGV
jgi:hypothetical protein